MRLLAAALLCVRVVLVGLAIQASGAPHVVAHAFEIDDDADEEESHDDGECPPGCPSCHGCAHVQVAIASSRDLDLAPAEAVMMRRDLAAITHPPSPLRDSLYRPPRA